jgi:thiamine biosynthesis lipoprotein
MSAPAASGAQSGGAHSGHQVHALGGATMGTRWQASVSAPPGADLHALHRGVQACLDRVVAQMSTWERDSDISRYNRAPARSWQALPQPFFDVLAQGLAIAEATGGACDPTVGPVVDLWGFGPGGRPASPPDPAAIAAARARVGWRRVRLDPEGCRAWQPGGVGLDLSGIAKGHGVDAAIDWLRTQGVPAALVEVGGELRAFGRKPDGRTWQVLAEAWPGDDGDDQGDDAAPPCVLALDDAAVATSGDCWHSFEHEGRRYSHTIDPRTGAPVEHAAAAVTVVAAETLAADAWATALTVVGPDAGFDLASRRGIAARFVVRADAGVHERATAAFLRHLAP